MRFAWLCALGLVAAVACSGAAADSASGGQPGVVLALGGGDARDCSPTSAGEPALLPDAAGAGNCPDVAVDYATQVAPILARCSGEVCHDFSDPSSVRAFIAAPADECCSQRELIAPGSPQQSYLMDKLMGRRLCYGSPMPLNRQPLPASELAVLGAWICQGAVLP